MKVLLQKVKSASVSVDGKVVGSIDKGYCLLVGVSKDSSQKDAQFLAKKIAEARIFEDAEGKINLGIKDVGGKVLSISQFTLYADTKKGKRPSFTDAARPDIANDLYEIFNTHLEKEGLVVEKGIFQTHMAVNIINDGPVTIMFEKIHGNS